MAVATHEPMVTTSDSGLLDEILWQTRNTTTVPEGLGRRGPVRLNITLWHRC
jgi:hypothetical protein